jgi:chromosome segregation ATPase
MVICVKCGKEQGRRSWSKCEYGGNEHAGSDHAWSDRGEFINELREKLPSFIKERIASWQKKYTEKQAVFSERLAVYRKRQDEIQKTLDEIQKRLDKIRQKKQDAIQAAYTAYLNEGLPRDVKKKKQSAIRSLLGEVIPCMIGVLIAFIWIFPLFNIDIIPFIILPMIGLVVFFLSKPVVKFWKAMRYTESQGFADELAREWHVNHKIADKIDELESDIEAEKDKWNNSRRSLESDSETEKDKWNNFRRSLERCIHSAERALVGSDEELLNYYNTDNQAKNWYLENIYDGEW